MREQDPILSVICIFRNKKERVEPTLKALYALEGIPCEFLFIDDGSTDGTSDAIRSLVEHYQHKQTYFFEHEATRGRGNSLNSAIEVARGRLLWLPESLQTIHRKPLQHAMDLLRGSGAQVAVGSEDPLPENALEWLQLLQNDRLPKDRHYLFDLKRIRPNRTFADPHWTTRHATEWAIRLHPDSDPIRVPSFCIDDDDREPMDDRSRKECVLALLRIPELSLSGQEKAFRMLRTFGHTDFEEEAESLEPLYNEAQALYKGGNSVAALELLNRILAADPDHRRARTFKVEILERMRRYVEAAEVKHRYPPARPEATQDKRDERTGRDDNTKAPDKLSEDQAGPESEAADPTDSAVDAHASAERGEASESGQTSVDAPHPDEIDGLSDSETFSEGVEQSHDDGPSENEEPSEVSDADGTSASGKPAATGEPSGATDQQEASKPSEPGEQPGSDKPGEPGEGEDSTETETSDAHSGEPAPGNTPREVASQLPLSIIIPTATCRRPDLEHCLTSVFRFTSRENTRVIVIDNGSVDDTPEYLEGLLRKNLPLTVLRNEQNLGFAAAVNQGLARAGDGYTLVMHNDVVLKSALPARLSLLLEKNPDIGLVVPATDHTWHPEQKHGDTTEDKIDDLAETDFVDGYCMAFRNEPGLVMSKQYGLAFFEDADFCCRIRKKGYRIVIARDQFVHHTSETTTRDLGLIHYGKAYWHNAALFHEEWQNAPRFPSDRTGDDPLHQFVLLGNLINPFYPEKHLLDYFQELFTSEQKTRVLHAEFPPDKLGSVIRLMMAANQREVLRHLEQQLDDLAPDPVLYHDLVCFYFERTIYSRCKRYLDRLDDGTLPPEMQIYRLKIAIGEKDYELAAVFLKELMDASPTHPEVLASAAEIHRRNGNEEQSAQFMELARVFDPYISHGR
ncbi:glycosyltransferase [Balneolales bacterium ANBcel1]|nr:glycosyltransferase [Balneolales bacterium ANBcel1]